MIAPRRKTVGSLLLVLVGALAGCTSYFEIPIETPIQPKLDIVAVPACLRGWLRRRRQRRIDGNLETVRLLRSQLRQKGALRVVESEAASAHDDRNRAARHRAAAARTRRRHV